MQLSTGSESYDSYWILKEVRTGFTSCTDEGIFWVVFTTETILPVIHAYSFMSSCATKADNVALIVEFLRD